MTALGLAASRAVESSMPDRLIDDPYAAALFSAAGAALPMRLSWPPAHEPVSDTEALHLHGSRYIGLRTRFYDEALIEAAERGITQAVLFGAGLDTRAYRLGFPPDFKLFELDQADVLTYKARVLAGQAARPTCQLGSVGADLREAWHTALLEHGFSPDRGTLWIAEGVLPYLDPASQVQLLERVHALSGAESALALDRIVGDPVGDGRARTLSEASGIDMNALFAAGDRGNLSSFLRERSWLVEEEPASRIAERYGRELRNPFANDDTAEPPWLDTTFLRAKLATGGGAGRH